MRLIWSFLAVAAVFGLGFHAGRDAEKREAKKQADALHRAFVALLLACGRIGARPSGQTHVDAPDPKPQTDTVAREPIVKPGVSVDRALANGEIAFYKDQGGTC